MGGAGQQALKRARVLVVGAGGLGSPVITYLAGAGIGTLGIVDNDTVALSNLHRQFVHTEIGANKAASAGRFASALNPHVTIVLHTDRLDAAGAAAIMANYDLVLDGTDNLATRRFVAAAAE